MKKFTIKNYQIQLFKKIKKQNNLYHLYTSLKKQLYLKIVQLLK